MNLSDNNPNNLRPGLFVLNLGFFRNFSACLFTYEQAVELIYGDIASGKQTADMLGVPLVFLMRHSLELGYKYTVFELYRLNPTDYGPDAFNHSVKRFSHRLSKWHGELKEAYDKIAIHFELSENERADFASHYKRTRVGMEKFEDLDAGSYNFRFPIDLQGRMIWSYDQKVDLLALKNSFDGAMILLRHTVDALSLCAENMAPGF